MTETSTNPRMNPNFRLFVVAQFVSMVAFWVRELGLGWVLVDLVDSPARIASISATASLSALAFLAHGSALADRLRRLSILRLTLVGYGTIGTAYAVLVATGQLHLTHVYALAALTGICTAYNLPSQQALVGELVPRTQVATAVATHQLATYGASIAGWILAGGLLIRWGVAPVFALNAVLAGLALSILGSIREPQRQRSDAPDSGIRGALGFVWAHQQLRAMLTLTALVMAWVVPFSTVFLPLAVKHLYGGDKATLTLLMLLQSLGAVIGALGLHRIDHQRPRAVAVAAASTGLSLIVLSQVASPWAAAPAVMVLGASTALTLGLSSTTLQLGTPSDLRGRVMGLTVMARVGLLPIFALLLAAFAEAFGIRAMVLFMGVGFAVLSRWTVTRTA